MIISGQTSWSPVPAFFLFLVSSFFVHRMSFKSGGGIWVSLLDYAEVGGPLPCVFLAENEVFEISFR